MSSDKHVRVFDKVPDNCRLCVVATNVAKTSLQFQTFNTFKFTLFTEPEIAGKPVEDLILQMKDLGIDRIINFPFPTPPDETAVKVAENLLVQLGALDIDKSRTKNIKDEQVTRITELGKTMASFPINPRYAKMLTLAIQQEEKDILSYVICLISGLRIVHGR